MERFRNWVIGLIALFTLGSGAFAVNYTMTQGAGTTFGSLVVATVNYPQMLACDPTTPTQCAAVDASGNLNIRQATAANLNATVVQGTAANLNATVAPSTAAAWGLGTTTQNSATVALGQMALGQFNTAPTTITSGNMSPFQLDASGNLLVNIKAGGAAGGTSSSFGAAFPGTGTAIGLTNGTNMVAWSATTNYGTAPAAIAVPAVNAFVTNANPNGRTTAANASPVVDVAAASTAGAIVPNNTTAVVVKASAGTLFGLQVYGIGSAPAYLKIYNATSATCGSGTPVKRIMIPAAPTAANGAGSNVTFGPGLAMATGITYCVTTGITDVDTTAPAANTFLVNVDYE